jgi:hypothetical protein
VSRKGDQLCGEKFQDKADQKEEKTGHGLGGILFIFLLPIFSDF